MSYLTDTIGGTLVAPPEMGELIPLMRNQSALDRAGARMVPLPPQGKWVAPRITGPSTGYWIGENTAISESNPTTGQVEMMAKKLACLVRVPNELFKYANASADAMLRTDIAKTLSLGFDYAGFYGTSGAQPKGLKFYDSTNEVLSYTASTVGTDGNTLNPQDGYLMSSNIEDRNFDLSGWKWIMRPKMWGKIASFRSSSGAVTTADQLGLFVQDLTRKLGDGAPAQWTGYPVVRSSQITASLTKGSGTGLTEIWGGVWNEFLMGLYGAVEFATATQGDTMFAADQTLIRGILHCDCVPRYPGAFARCSDLVMS
jgi:HK97 family phage major capsid protein